jgi:hypothetical protein
MADPRRFELEDLVVRPGTYFNPQTEVLLVVDDSPDLDSEIFDMEDYEGADWVLISDETPVDEHAREVARGRIDPAQREGDVGGGALRARAREQDLGGRLWRGGIAGRRDRRGDAVGDRHRRDRDGGVAGVVGHDVADVVRAVGGAAGIPLGADYGPRGAGADRAHVQAARGDPGASIRRSPRDPDRPAHGTAR